MDNGKNNTNLPDVGKNLLIWPLWMAGIALPLTSSNFSKRIRISRAN